MDQMVKALLSTVAETALTGLGPPCGCKPIVGKNTTDNNRLEPQLCGKIIQVHLLFRTKESGSTPVVEQASRLAKILTCTEINTRVGGLSSELLEQGPNFTWLK